MRISRAPSAAALWPTVVLLGLGVPGLAPALSVPFLASDVEWLLRYGLPITSDGAVAARFCLIAAYLVAALLLARVAAPSNHRNLQLVAALTSPFAFRFVTWAPALPVLVGAAVILVGWRAARRRSAAMAFGIALAALGAALAWTGFAHAPADMALLLAGTAAWLVTTRAARRGLTALTDALPLKRRFRIPIMTIVSLVLPALLASGWLYSSAWMRAIDLAASVVRALDRLPVGESRILVLNAPTGLILPGTSAQSPTFDSRLVADLPGVSRARMIEGNIGAPGSIGGFPAVYGGAQTFDRAGVVQAAIRANSLVLFAYGARGLSPAADVGGLARSAPDAPIARFTSSEGEVEVLSAIACGRDNAMWLTMTFRVQALRSGESKAFRHALRGEAQLATNDASLLGGLVELSDLPIGKAIRDVSITQPESGQPDAARWGIYNWRSGARWTAASTPNTPPNVMVTGDAIVVPLSPVRQCPSP